MICVPCSMMDLLGATVGREVAQECACKTAIALLVRLGAVHTAKMHAKDAAENPENWPEQDWLFHMQEEELLFFPLLPAHVSRQFVQEHDLFKSEFKKFGKIKSLDVLKAHSARENMWAEKLLADSEDPQAQARVGRSPDREVEDPKSETSIPASEQAKPYAGKWLSLTSYQDKLGRTWTFTTSDPPAPVGYSDWIQKDGTRARIAIATPNWLGTGDYKAKIGSLFDQWEDAPKDKPETKASQPSQPTQPVKKSGFKLEPTHGILLAGFGMLLGLGFLVTGFLSRRLHP